MLTGITPYFTKKKENIFHNIECSKLKIPKFVSEEAGEILTLLLEKDPMKRLGGKKDAEEIKEHKYFNDVDWNKIYKKEIIPPKANVYIKQIVNMFQKPKLFSNDNGENYEKYIFQGWSFVNTNEK